MYLCFCDLCHTPIKEHEVKYIFGINKLTQNNSEHNSHHKYDDELEYLRDIIGKLKKQSTDTQINEICEKCKRVFDHFINLRANRIKKISKELEKLTEGEK